MTRAPVPPAGPLSRRFDAASVRDSGTSFRVETSAAERDALAADCDLVALDALEGDFRVVRDGAAGLRATGTVTARVRQICVVTLEEFASDLSESVDIRFAPAEEVEALEAARAAHPPTLDEEDVPDLPDPIVNGRIDLGALTAEILVLSLDPYPKKPGAAFAEPEPEAPNETASPFAALRNLKDQGSV